MVKDLLGGKCKKCGEAIAMLLLEAVVLDAGGYVSGSHPTICSAGGKHEFEFPEKEDS